MSSKVIEIQTAEGPFKFSNEHGLKAFRIHLDPSNEDAKRAHEYYCNGRGAWFFYGVCSHPENFFWSYQHPLKEGMLLRIEQIDNDDWRIHARHKFQFEKWEHPNWPVKDDPERYAHVIKDGDSYLIRFIASEEHGKRGRLSTMKPGRYLTKYHPDIDAERVKEIVAGLGKALVVQWAVTAEEIVHVYENGPSSCMASKGSDYKGHVHPCAVYGDSDLRLAYLKRQDRIVARALVWEDKKRIGRAYGDENRLYRALEELGYVSGDFDGAKVRAIKNEDGQGYIMPYIDNNSYCELSGEWFIIGDGGVGCQNTNGLCYMGKYCHSIGGYHDEEDGYYCEDDGDFISQAALDRGYGFMCELTGNVYRSRSSAIFLADGRMVHRDAYYDHDGYYCDRTNQYYLEEDEPSARYEDSYDVTTRAWAEENAYCDPHGNWWMVKPEEDAQEAAQTTGTGVPQEAKEAPKAVEATRVAEAPRIGGVLASGRFSRVSHGATPNQWAIGTVAMPDWLTVEEIEPDYSA